jgi:hypothetical protein
VTLLGGWFLHFREDFGGASLGPQLALSQNYQRDDSERQTVMTNKTKILAVAAAAVTTMLGMGATAVVLSDDIDQTMAALQDGASVDETDSNTDSASWYRARWGYRSYGYRSYGYRAHGWRGYYGYRGHYGWRAAAHRAYGWRGYYGARWAGYMGGLRGRTYVIRW